MPMGGHLGQPRRKDAMNPLHRHTRARIHVEYIRTHSHTHKKTPPKKPGAPKLWRAVWTEEAQRLPPATGEREGLGVKGFCH